MSENWQERAEQAEALVGRALDVLQRFPAYQHSCCGTPCEKCRWAKEVTALLTDPLGTRLAEEQQALRWRVILTCCGRDAGTEQFETWEEADAFRNSYTSGYGVDRHGYGECACGGTLHRRSGQIVAVERARGGGAR